MSSACSMLGHMPIRSDSEILSAIGHGQAEFGWDEWFGDVDTADYLTSVGKRAAKRAAADLTEFFGPGWLSRALEPDPAGAAIPILGSYAPLLALTPARRAGRYVESIRWWASIQTLSEAGTGGLSAVRRDVRHNLTAHRLVHTLTQARLASVGLYTGAEVTLEPGKSGGPGDLLLGWRGHEIFLEVVTFGPDVTSQAEDKHHQRHFLYLLSLRPGEPVYWEGDVPGLLNPVDEAAWIRATNAAASRCAQTGEPVDIPGPDGACLTVRPGTAPKGTSTRGPYLTSDDGSRLARSIDRKGAQTRGVGIAWVWAEDFGGMHPIAPFTSMPIDAKLEALAELIRPILKERPHLAGIVWSSGQWNTQAPPDTQAHTLAGIGLQRALPVERVRQSVILNRRLILPDQTARMAQICGAEPRWLSWALARLGIEGGVSALLTQKQPARAVKSRLWVP
jgi:hypothetical protein